MRECRKVAGRNQSQVINLFLQEEHMETNQPIKSPSTMTITPAFGIIPDLVNKSSGEWFDPFAAMPVLEDILEEIGPLPENTVFFGQAEDGLPVLLNLQNATPGAILITADSGAGKTHLLKIIAQYVISAYSSKEIQFVVVTNHAAEWNNFVGFPHCVGIFSPQQTGVAHLLQSLAAWMDAPGNKHQSVLLLIDGMEEALYCDTLAQAHLRKVLSDGSTKHIWPIVTYDPNYSERAKAWLHLFRTKIHGYTQTDDPGVDHLRPSSRGYFSLKEGSQWIRFCIPAFDN
jgi:hypothetical protein